MQNPIKSSREAQGLARTAFAMRVGLSYRILAAIELGHQRSIPAKWRAGFEAAGFDFDQLNEDYRVWRAAMANER